MEPPDWLKIAASSLRQTALRAENAVPVVDCIGLGLTWATIANQLDIFFDKKIALANKE